MSTDVILFILRLISALLLLGILAAVMFAVWLQYRSTVRRVEAARRSYGRLVPLIDVDGRYMQRGDSHPLLPLTTLGRALSNTITINDSFASGDHARIVLRDGQWWLEDCRSRNGTLLNGMPVQRPVIMTDGDVIAIGETLFRLELE
ncbi:MAG: FHA domain-containing protein [Phototrophicaceae bacterium]